MEVVAWVGGKSMCTAGLANMDLEEWVYSCEHIWRWQEAIGLRI